jgi:hypothetical protein
VIQVYWQGDVKLSDFLKTYMKQRISRAFSIDLPNSRVLAIERAGHTQCVCVLCVLHTRSIKQPLPL